MIEVELKAALDAARVPTLTQILLNLGFEAGETVREADTYYNAPDRDFSRTDEALRLRRYERMDGGTRALIAYKGPKQHARSSTRAEFETAVGSAETAQMLLAALGYRALFAVDKVRRTFVRGVVTVCLDHVAGLGNYVELEILAREETERDGAVDELYALLDRLGLRRDDLTRLSYLELLMSAATENKSS